ncbi:hypothetical protein GCM10007385_35010 [Tateyamaria omphalii]|uniref:BNR-4 repeat-containing protein n=1 Tax=Tateyamaria omphalii TaxID=299262 RepID=UPI001677ACEA|nr:BNR-4 repeat-containing protein [Tateyamaria omphalii]GGX62879.1 hypothetical protein GCM10007385_35010 [Tateyamaria omphalii]
MLKHLSLFPILIGLAGPTVADPVRLPITVKPFDNVKLIGPARQNQELRLIYQGDAGNTAEFACYRNGEPILGLSKRLRTYRTRPDDIGTLIECSLTEPHSQFEMRSPPVGPIRTGTLNAADETLTVEELHSVPDGAYSTYVKNLRHMPSVVTHEGEIFFVYVDNEKRPIIGKVARDKKVTTAPLVSDSMFKIEDDNHHNFSIGVDSKGFLHVAGNMHRYTGQGNSAAENDKGLTAMFRGQRILLWRSAAEGDISQFNFKGRASDGVPEGTGFTYTAFKSGMDGELYMRARINLGPKVPFRYPLSALALYKYDPTRQVWDAIEGEIDPQQYRAYFDFTPRAFLWEDNGNDGRGYQGYLSGMTIDFDNTLHVASAVNNTDSATASHIVYARSKDGGTSWERSDGTAIDALPLRVDPGPGQAEIVFSPADHAGGYFTQVHVAASMTGAPIMTTGLMTSAIDGGFENIGGFRAYDNRTEVWSPLLPDPLSASNDTLVVTDVNGITTMMHHKGSGRIYRLYDGDVVGYETQFAKDLDFSGYDERALREKAAIVGLAYPATCTIAPCPTGLKLYSIKTDVAGIPLPELGATEVQSEEDWKWARTQIGGGEGAVTVANNIFKFTGTGMGFGDATSNSLQFTHKLVSGDFEFVARIINIDYTSPNSFAGLMIANGADETSDAVAAYVNASGKLRTHVQVSGAKTPLDVANREASEWLKIARIGKVVRVYHGSNGTDWTLLSERFVGSLSNQLHVGLINGGAGVLGSNDDPNGVARIDNIQLFKM